MILKQAEVDLSKCFMQLQASARMQLLSNLRSKLAIATWTDHELIE